MPKLFNASEFTGLITDDFLECPSTMTIGRHADLNETAEIHCFGIQDQRRMSPIAYYVPKQPLITRRGPESSSFCLVKVSKKQDFPPQCWLVIYGGSGRGFLVPIETFDDQGNESDWFLRRKAYGQKLLESIS